MVSTAECCSLSSIYQWYVTCSTSDLNLMLSSDKTIKLWKVFEKTIRVVSQSHLAATASRPFPSNAHLRLPTVVRQDDIVAAVPRKVYSNAHAYHINSISINSDGETYISADDLRINLWNLNISDQSFSEHHDSFHDCAVKAYGTASRDHG